MPSIRALGILSLMLMSIVPQPALAGPAADALGQCLVGKTTGDERILLVRWMTFGFASHPAVKDAITMDASKLDAANRAVAALVNDLLLNRCSEQTKAAMAEGNNPGIAMQTAFQALGGAAAREVMTAPEVTTAISGFAAYLDKNAIAALMGAK